MSAATDDLAGRVCVVTGGASGIGLALVARLAQAGADVLVVDIDEGAAAAAARAHGVRYVGSDASDPVTWRAVERAVERVDHAFLNAGTGTRGSFLDVPWEECRRVLAVNLEAVVLGVRSLVPRFARDGGGIVVTASAGAIDPVQLDPLYTAGKHAAVGFVRAAAAGLALQRIRLSAVCPALVDTPFLGPVGGLMAQAGFALLSSDEVARTLLRAALEAEAGAVWAVSAGRGVVPLVFPGMGPDGV